MLSRITDSSVLRLGAFSSRAIRASRASCANQWILSRSYSSSEAPKKSGPASLTPAGTRLKGLGVLKNKEEPIALTDEEYPEWLWQVLDVKAQAKALEADPIKAAKKARRAQNRKQIKAKNFLASMEK